MLDMAEPQIASLAKSTAALDPEHALEIVLLRRILLLQNNL